MSVCLCPVPRSGVRRCRALAIVAETGAMNCGREVQLAELLRAAVVDGVDNAAERDALEFDPAGFVVALRAAGWRIDAPRRKRAV